MTNDLQSDPNTSSTAILRIFALSVVALALSFILSNYLNFWQNWPGIPTLFSHLGLFGAEPLRSPLSADQVTLGWAQIALYIGPVAGLVYFVLRSPGRTMHEDSDVLSNASAYIIRAAFWSVLLIGLVDSVISFLRVENFLEIFISAQLEEDLGKSNFRGVYVHYPLMVVSMVIAAFKRTVGFTWLALLIVVAEIQIVIARFVFSYEQAFMADLVRFWYGALFLFASPYTLIHEGHVRVDILYASFSERGKAWTNAIGSAFLGMPLCWIVLTRGMWGKSNVITGPLLNFEVTQAGYGLYVKYLLAGFLLIFAISMLIQFMSYFLSSAAVLLREPGYHPDTTEHANV
jgi:TRAP-type mannitol/chloroaromatic compound transport system permease small subunit